MIRSSIIDGNGSGREALVTDNYALKVQVVPETSKGLSSGDLANLRLLRTFLKDAGGSQELAVDASTITQEFFIASEPGKTKWITSLRILLEGTGLEMNTQDFRRFGSDVNGLTNGIQITATQEGEVTLISAEPIQFVGDFFSYADAYVNIINSVSAQSDFLSFDIIFEKPIVLAQGGNDNIKVTLTDDLTVVDKFQILVRGYQETVE